MEELPLNKDVKFGDHGQYLASNFILLNECICLVRASGYFLEVNHYLSPGGPTDKW